MEDNEIISPPAGLMTQLMMATLGQKYSPSWELYFTKRQDILSIFKQSRSFAPCKFLSNLKTKQKITITMQVYNSLEYSNGFFYLINRIE